MKEKDFIKKIIELYRAARISKFSHKKISRGRSHSISSFSEDLFARFLINRIAADFIYVDQPISIKGSDVQNYPDIIVVKNNIITSFCDLKIDLGHQRNNLYNLCGKYKSWLGKVRGKRCKARDGITKKDHFYKISKKATYDIVLISNQNISKKLLQRQIIQATKFSPNVKVFILSKDEHPNTYGISVDKLMQRIYTNTKDFERLVGRLK